MNTMRAVIADANYEGVLKIETIPAPIPLPSEALIDVRAISLNRGEVRMSRSPKPGWRPGWDFAGVVSKAAENGTGPRAGDRVVGISRSGAWAEQVAVPVEQIAVLPEKVSFSQAATLPVAGLTALHCLIKGGFLLEKSVLITGATGGVGDFAIQLAKLAGARVIANIRKPEQEAFVREIGADEVLIGETLEGASKFAPYSLVIDSVGGKTLGSVLEILDENSKVVSIGTSSGNEVVFNAEKFYGVGLVTLYGMILFDELKTVESASLGLSRLAGLVAKGKLTPRISLEEDWANIATVAQKLLDRSYPGKAVLTLD